MTDYCFPESIDEALELLGRYGGDALVIAGGTDVLPDVRRGRKNPHCLVDITRIPELDRITVEKEYVEVGAAVTFSALRSHRYLQLHVHALSEAAAAVGAADIQNVATWAGNLVQAMPAADGAIVALALDAQVRLHDAQGSQWLAVGQLFAGPGRSAVDSTRQIVTHIRFPIPAQLWGTGWRRLGRREALVLPILSCAARLELAQGHITHAAIALGPVTSIPIRATAAEGFLLGQAPEPTAFGEAGRIAASTANPRSSPTRASREYRLAVLPTLVQDALAVATTRALERQT